MFFHGKINDTSRKIHKLNSEIKKAQDMRAQQLDVLSKHYPLAAGLIPLVEESVPIDLEAGRSQIEQLLKARSTSSVGAWGDPGWENWQPEALSSSPPRLRYGQLDDTFEPLGSGLQVPAWCPLVGVDQTGIIPVNNQSYDAGLAVFQSLILRVALELPHRVTFSLLDPAGQGRAFPLRRLLPRIEETGDELYADLRRIQQNIRRINENYLDVSAPTFHELPEEILQSERFEFVFVADFPNGFDRRSIELLQNIASNGPTAGRYTYVLWNTNVELPRDVTMDGFTNKITIPSPIMDGFNLTLDGLPQPVKQEQLLDKLRSAKQPDIKISWAEVGSTPKDEWWSRDASLRIEAFVGRSGSKGEHLKLWFGVDDDGRPCAHGMLGAMTGAGKSNLYHVLIAGLTTRYSPDELRLFLIDGKEGVEFAPYRDLPHAEVVSLHSTSDLTRSVLRELVEEKERRNELFASHGVRDLVGYRQLPHSPQALPRILLLVDEYQELFEDDKDGEASALLLQLATQGRSAGIHMLLASQRYGVPGMLNQQAVFGNMHLRIAMQMTQSDVQSLTEFGRKGRVLVRACDLPGKVVINDQSGEDAGNSTGRLAFLDDSEITNLVADLKEFSLTRESPVAQKIILDGNEPPRLALNPYLRGLMERDKWLSPDALENFARRARHDGGLGEELWSSAEFPLPIFCGQEFNVRGQTVAVLTRRPGQNIAMVGADLNVRYGLIVAAILSLASAVGPKGVEFSILDGTVPNTPRSNLLPTLSSFLSDHIGFTSNCLGPSDDVASFVASLQSHQTSSGTVQRSKFTIIVEPERFEVLRRPTGFAVSDSEGPGGNLRSVFADGSSKGCHFLVSSSSVRLLSLIVDERKALHNFNHRIALQMSEDDSFTFTRGRKASRLNADRPMPLAALYSNLEGGYDRKLKPYTSNAPFADDSNWILEQLAARKSA